MYDLELGDKQIYIGEMEDHYHIFYTQVRERDKPDAEWVWKVWADVTYGTYLPHIFDSLNQLVERQVYMLRELMLTVDTSSFEDIASFERPPRWDGDPDSDDDIVRLLRQHNYECKFHVDLD